jgi:hypothetical protein
MWEGIAIDANQGQDMRMMQILPNEGFSVKSLFSVNISKDSF